MTASKNWCKVDIDLNTNKHEDWNLVFANHKEEDEIYPLTTIETAEAQRKDQELKINLKKKCKDAAKGYLFSTY